MFWTSKIRNKKGYDAENQALAHLLSEGLKLRERNYACKLGELDLVMQEQETIVFVEVRYRNGEKFGSAAESVHHQKQKRLCNTAQHYLQTFKLTDRFPCRFDTITIQPASPPDKGNKVSWIKNAFGA
ncbi:YraN family protein [Parendozoicomonas haliclonae]|uniref:UPF0102 protein EHSB41UT_00358 n=1 Tax=Parendozoicomonas haliclonae TaxID=1960125 RepID=A0A1X7AEH8_9GAMM|nr:YraN family protein [Parendozoicomonas haliclonae]SMA34087.1 hypothetical protein EHSB41UT_00358 [Parendozoicomonas haliclonae]